MTSLAVPRRRMRPIALAMVSLALGVLVVFLILYFQRGFIPGDGTVYLGAGERLNAGHPLYALSPGDREVGLKPPYWTVPLLSPPFIAVIFRPLALLPPDLGAYVWWAGTLAAIGIVLFWYLRRRPVLGSLAILALVVPLTYEIGVGNMNAFLLLGSVMVWRWTMTGHERWAGWATAAGVLLKVSPILVAWWLFTQRRWSAVRAGIGAGLVLGAISLIGAGIDAHLRYLQIARDTATTGLSDLSLAGLAKAVGVAPSLANLVPPAVLLVGVVGMVLLRNRPGPAFALAVATMTVGSPVVNINSYALLLGCLAPWVWPAESAEGARAEAPASGSAVPTDQLEAGMAR